jgi:hypothetical protein
MAVTRLTAAWATPLPPLMSVEDQSRQTGAVTRPKSAYSTEGIECPFCGHVFAPDEPQYYDESGYDFECDDCDGVFRVEPQVSWAWRSRAITWETD